jgi:DNA segregation ATPase FtsK/SpoIIIE, S-DNA-T family
MQLDLSSLLPEDKSLSLPGPAVVQIPIHLSYPDHGSVLIETASASDDVASQTINNIMMRLLSETPPGKLSFTIMDPVGLGQNFAGIMHLGDYEETLINRRIWTQREQIEERLKEINDHIEKVIQMYLRNEYETITQYNAEAGSVSEKYQFLVIADFPANFSDLAAKRLQSIVVSGPRCGVFTLIHRDTRQGLPDGFTLEELLSNSVHIHADKGRLSLTGAPAEGQLSLDAPASDALAVELLHRIGKASIDSNRVQVPFTQIAPKDGQLWIDDTTNELRVPIGRTGATKHQYLSIGKGTRQHALFAGKTGSGKSTLFHIIITNLALHCSPDQVEFYLIDFKKGVEFKCYATARLPHAKVIAIESDREFGLSVLQRVDDELKRRGDMFRKLGVQDIAGYKRAGGTEAVPRSLLIIDEFQEFFVQDDTISQNASLLFDRIVRQGRAFGLHVLLGSQTLGGAFTLARATMGQMVIRVALQCNEADAMLIMDDNNPAPRLLTRPGEGIYNDAAGAIEGNSPFQVCWLSDEERDQWLDKIRHKADDQGMNQTPICFEGNAPADIGDNQILARAMASPATTVPLQGRIWLGSPNSIKGPTEAIFQPQSGQHLLIVGQREEVTLTMIGYALLALAAQYPVGKVKLVCLHQSIPGSAETEFLHQVIAAIPHGVRSVQGHDLAEGMNELHEELTARNQGTSEAPVATYVFVHGLQKFKKLKGDDDMDFSFGGSDSGPSPASQLTALINEGSTQGMHLILATDTYNNVTRFLSRKLLAEIEMRLVFQMSANDSASLIDNPKASELGLHRAVLYNEQAGSLETFRPYAEPTGQWIESCSRALRR